jgi:hypothetical protein
MNALRFLVKMVLVVWILSTVSRVLVYSVILAFSARRTSMNAAPILVNMARLVSTQSTNSHVLAFLALLVFCVRQILMIAMA